MKVRLELSDSLLGRLEVEVGRRGTTVEAIVVDAVARAFPAERPQTSPLGFIGIAEGPEDLSSRHKELRRVAARRRRT